MIKIKFSQLHLSATTIRLPTGIQLLVSELILYVRITLTGELQLIDLHNTEISLYV